jgi:hypothetical protein
MYLCACAYTYTHTYTYTHISFLHFLRLSFPSFLPVLPGKGRKGMRVVDGLNCPPAFQKEKGQKEEEGGGGEGAPSLPETPHKKASVQKHAVWKKEKREGRKEGRLRKDERYRKEEGGGGGGRHFWNNVCHKREE